MPIWLTILGLMIWEGFCSQSTQEQIMIASQYEGRWLMTPKFIIPNNSHFEMFNAYQGDVLVDFQNLGNETDKVEGITLKFFNPKYYDQKLIVISLGISKTLNQETDRWEGLA